MDDNGTVKAHVIEPGEVLPFVDGPRLERWTKLHTATEGGPT
jgi:hypothetical protein